MAKANWHKAPFSTNARNEAGRDDDRREIASQKVEKAAKPRVDVAVRCCGIDFMYRRGDISEAQKDVADRFYGVWQAANANGLQAIDYSKVRVDGTRHGSGGMIDRRIHARDELERIRAALGQRVFAVPSIAAGEEGGLQAVADAIGKSKATAGRSVGPALDALSRHWGAEGQTSAEVPRPLAG